MIQIIPAIDLIDGKCVRLEQGDFKRAIVYHEDPVEMAKSFEDAGIKRLHLVDLDGAKTKKVVNWRVLEHITAQTSLVVDFGGGVQSDEDIRLVFESGGAMVTCGSIAVKKTEKFLQWVETYGPEKLILAADARDRKIAVHGWQETSEQTVIEFLEFFQNKGITQVLCTDISRDGMLSGPALSLYQEIKQAFPALSLIASGGISDMNDIIALDESKIESVVVGKAFYEGHITVEDMASYNG